MKEEKKNERIEPPCEACVAARAESGGKQQWCREHARPHVHGRGYDYTRQIPYAQHDSSVVPTGIDQTPGRRI